MPPYYLNTVIYEKKIVNHLPLILKVQFSDFTFSWTKALALDLNAEPRIITKSNRGAPAVRTAPETAPHTYHRIKWFRFTRT